MELVAYPVRSEVWLVSLEPTRGSEIRKTRPCVVVSPDETNRLLKTVIVAPLTSKIKNYPTRLRRYPPLWRLHQDTVKDTFLVAFSNANARILDTNYHFIVFFYHT